MILRVPGRDDEQPHGEEGTPLFDIYAASPSGEAPSGGPAPDLAAPGDAEEGYDYFLKVEGVDGDVTEDGRTTEDLAAPTEPGPADQADDGRRGDEPRDVQVPTAVEHPPPDIAGGGRVDEDPDRPVIVGSVPNAAGDVSPEVGDTPLLDEPSEDDAPPSYRQLGATLR